ncbi:hypothetical protein [Methylocystis heyeri]|uniref:Uncharacterized protein n=1 Tax=Methylocystis heyeri TaxID=391905 RepID=A0A6B8KH96_9HYPH|nr:hypothetical protein [Methylocystis heyeri]QGM45820.1 hypothetical protein H2LOC_008960 [Methylocystis heyeri]
MHTLKTDLSIALALMALSTSPAAAQTARATPEWATLPAPQVPYISTQGTNTPCYNSQCIVTFPAAPAGKRLVVTSVTAQLSAAISDVVLLEGNGFEVFATKSSPYSNFLTANVLDYFGPGVAPTARVYSGSAPSSLSIIVTIAGYTEAQP